MILVVTTAGRSRDSAATVLAAQSGTDRSTFAMLTRNHPSDLGSDPNTTPWGKNPGIYLSQYVIMRRAQLGLTQQELAERMGTTKSVISRIERGQHRTSTDTLRRLAEALDGHAVIGFEFDAGRPPRDLVRL